MGWPVLLLVLGGKREPLEGLAVGRMEEVGWSEPEGMEEVGWREPEGMEEVGWREPERLAVGRMEEVGWTHTN